MIAEKTDTPVEILQERVLKLEQELARMREELVSVKNSLVEVAPVTRKRVSFETASAEVLTGYSGLLQRLSQ